MNSKDRNQEDQILDCYTCDEEERAKWARERAEKERDIDGLKRYLENGVQVYIDGKPAGPFDWEKLTMLREDDRFYMADYIGDDSRIKEIRFDAVYHGDIQPERDVSKRRGKKKTTGRNWKYGKEVRLEDGTKSREGNNEESALGYEGSVDQTSDV